MVPSGLPTITGEVSYVSLSGFVTSDISSSDILDISNEIAQIYGVDEDDTETTVEYILSGTLNITIPDDINEDDVINSLQESISNALGVHSSDVVVTFDDEGVITYSVSGSTFTEVASLQASVEHNDFVNSVNDALRQSELDILLEAISSNEDIETVISVTVDTTVASETQTPEIAIAQLVSEYDLTDSTIECNTLLLYVKD